MLKSLETDEAFGSIHNVDITKMKSYVSKDCIVKTIVGYGIMFLSVSIDTNSSTKKWR